ncbi:MAG: Hsp70 family protein, partial [Candidatus Dadabacteria bacterium]|nr:Hsp70 family protein [Candidatus Dadabacteria bacterium]
ARFILDGLPPASRGVPQIEVTFDTDADGILHVSAKDMASGKEQKVRVEASSGLGKDEVDKMVRDAEEKADDDRRRHELVENRNKLDELIYRTEKSFKEFESKLSESDRKELEEALEEGRSAIKGNDPEAIAAATDKITKASHKLAELMYKQQAESETQQPGGDGAEPGASEPEEGSQDEGPKDDGDDVIDAEFTEK